MNLFRIQNFVAAVPVAIFICITVFLFVASISVVSAQAETDAYSDAELYSLMQTIDEAAGEQLFPELRSEADIAALSVDDREWFVVDLLDIQANLDMSVAMDGFSSPVQCFDYYTFGSVNAPIHADVSNPVAGTEVEFTVKLTNNNPYPVVDANVYVKLFRERPAQEQSAQLAHLVDQFQAIEGVTIPASTTREHTFTYDIPAALPSGEYKMVTFVSTAERYNLLGLPFTDDVIGDSTTLTIVGDQEGMVQWDRDQVLVDLQQHFFASFIPEVSPTEPVRISAPIHNELDTPIDGQLTWKVYHWDQQNQANLIDTTSRPISIAAGDTIPATFTLENTDHAVYVVVGEVEYEGATSLINVRFARTDISEIRLNYPGVMSYPLVEGEENTLFSCVHSASSFNLVPDSRLDLTLSDAQGNEIHSYTYEGSVSSAMMGVANTFVPQQSYDTFTLSAALYQNDTLVEEVSFHYDCTELSDDVCVATTDDKQNTGFFGFGQSNGSMTVLVGILAVFMLLIAVAWYFVSKRKEQEQEYDTTLPSLLLLGVLGIAMLLPGTVDAQVTNTKPAVTGNGLSITAADTYGGNLSRRHTFSQDPNSRVDNALSGPHATVHYHADIYNETSGGMVVPGDTVAVNDVLRFEPRLGQIDWFGTGQYSDSPLGVWYNQALFPQSVLSNFDFFGWKYRSTPEPAFRVNDEVTIPFSVHPADTNVSIGGTATLRSLGRNRYQMLDGGTVQATFTFAPTYGYYYFGRLKGGIRADYPGLDPMRTQDLSGGYDYAATFGERKLIVAFEARSPAPGGNEAPLPPVITGSAVGVPYTQYDFAIEGTDPDGDSIYYEIDWTGDEVANYSSAEVSSGDTITVTRNWSTLGAKTFYARTVDEYGTNSAWTSHTITINEPFNVAVSLEIKDQFGNWTASDTQLPPSTEELTLRWTSTDATDCSGNGFAMEGATPANRLNNTQTIPAPLPGDSLQLTVTCTNETDSAVDSLNAARAEFDKPEVTVSTRVNSGSFTTSDKVVMEGDDITLRWTSTNAEQCTGMHIPSTAGPTGETSVPSPNPGMYTDYNVVCVNSNGDTANDTIRITFLAKPTVVFESSVDGVARSAVSPRSFVGGENIDLHWTAADADYCNGTGFSTAGAVQSPAGGVSVAPNADGSQTTYSIECGNAAGTVSRDIIFVSIQPDLVPENLSIRTSVEDDPSLFSTTTGEYNYVTVSFNAANRGDVVTPATDPRYAMRFNAGSDASVELDTIFDLEGNIPVNGSVAKSTRINNVQFGDSDLYIRLNLNNAISEKDLDNNTATLSTSILPPNPGISLEAEQEIVRSGASTRLFWEVGAAYPMACTVFWQGNQYSFNPSLDGSSGELPDGTDPITSRTIFQLSCTEPSTNTTFTDTAEVEAIGTQAEV